ncbi:MAG TPA: hypothetical protein VGZ25_08975 [Gemmataceae bacterium]|nr:hypothetical protein [Gemmataceae bacterium]
MLRGHDLARKDSDLAPLISKEKVMQPILATLPTLAVSATFCIWNAYRAHLNRRNKLQHERVAYMLWVMANETD